MRLLDEGRAGLREAGRERLPVIDGDPCRRPGQMDLPFVFQRRGRVFGTERLRRKARRIGQAARLQPDVDRLDLRGRLDVPPFPRLGSHVIVLQVREQHADRTEHRRLPGDDDQRHIQFAGQHTGVQRSGAAGHDEGELARVVAAFDRRDAQGRGHVGVDEPIDALGRFECRQAERLGNGADDGGSAAAASSVTSPPSSPFGSR